MEILNEFNKLIISKYGTYTISEDSEEFSFIKELDNSMEVVNIDDVKKKVLSNIRNT